MAATVLLGETVFLTGVLTVLVDFQVEVAAFTFDFVVNPRAQGPRRAPSATNLCANMVK